MGWDEAEPAPGGGCARRLWPRPATRGWLLFALALAVFLVLAGIDNRLKRAPHGGFAPEDADLRVYSAQWPGFWKRLTLTDAAQAAAEPLRKLTHQASLPVLRRTGIRPTPARWRLWLGPTLLLGCRADDWGASFRPGMLARAAHLAHSVVTGQWAGDGVYQLARFRPGSGQALHYAWRDGFLLVSPSPDYLRAALDAPAGPSLPEDVGDLYVSLRRGRNADLRLAAEDGWPFQGSVDLALPSGEAPLRLLEAWPDEPMLALSASSWPQVQALRSAILRTLPPAWLAFASERLLPLAAEAWGFDRLDDAWAANVGECSLAMKSGESWPRVAVALEAAGDTEGEHPLLPVIEPEDRIPVSWRANDLGVMAPLLGGAWTLCLDDDPDAGVWLATSTEPLMARLRGRLNVDGAPTEGVFAGLLRWCDAGPMLADSVRAALASQLVPGWSEEDLEPLVDGFASVAEHLGTARFTAHGHAEQVRFTGMLADQTSVAR